MEGATSASGRMVLLVLVGGGCYYSSASGVDCAIGDSGRIVLLVIVGGWCYW